MSTSITTAFVRQYEREVHEAFQRKSTKLLNTTRHISGVVGESTTFQKVGKGAATTKARHGLITPMNQGHTAVTVTLSDFYAGDWTDKLDEAKINHDERQVIVNGGAYAIARKIDNQIVTALDTTTNSQAHASTGLTKAKLQASLEAMGDFDVFEEGRMYATIGWNGWNDLMNINEFAQAEYVGGSLPWLDGTEARRFMGTVWVPSSVTNDVKSGSTFLSFWYHETSIGYASAEGITADITWHGDRASHFINHAMSGQAVMIDDEGVQEIQHQ